MEEEEVVAVEEGDVVVVVHGVIVLIVKLQFPSVLIGAVLRRLILVNYPRVLHLSLDLLIIHHPRLLRT